MFMDKHKSGRVTKNQILVCLPNDFRTKFGRPSAARVIGFRSCLCATGAFVTEAFAWGVPSTAA